MKPLDSPPVWIIRLLRISAALLIAGCLAMWVLPINATGQNLIPVGCGSPATPVTDQLTDFICSDHVGSIKVMVAALLVAAALLLLLSELVLPRLAFRSWLRGAVPAAIIAVPAFALSVSALFVVVASEGADGTLIRCGTPIAPSGDVISKQLCADLPERQKILSLAIMGISLLTVLGAAYVAKGAGPGELTPVDAGDDLGTGGDAPVTDGEDHLVSPSEEPGTADRGISRTMDHAGEDRP